MYALKAEASLGSQHKLGANANDVITKSNEAFLENLQLRTP